MRKIPLHWKILIGMALGIIFALLVSPYEWGITLIRNWISPFGAIFINSLKLIAIPLIFGSLIKGISDLKDISKLSRMGGRTIGLFLSTTIVATSLGLFVVNVIKPGSSLTEDTRASLITSYKNEATLKISEAKKQKDEGPLQLLIELVPENLVRAASNNGNMLQVIFFALFFGASLLMIPTEKSSPVIRFFDGFNEVILKMIGLIMAVAPFGVFALLASLIAEAPSPDLFLALLWYVFTLLLGLGLMMVFYLFLVKFYARYPPSLFLRKMAPAQLLGFSTSSSAATLPVTMECVEKKIGVSEDVTSFVLPVGATINMDGTSLHQSVAAIFIAQAFGLDLSLGAQLGIIVTAVLASIGSAAVPGAGMVMLVIVLGQAGIPEAGLALIFAVDRPLDMCRTIINVSGDATVSMCVAKSLRLKTMPASKE